MMHKLRLYLTSFIASGALCGFALLRSPFRIIYMSPHSPLSSRTLPRLGIGPIDAVYIYVGLRNDISATLSYTGQLTIELSRYEDFHTICRQGVTKVEQSTECSAVVEFEDLDSSTTWYYRAYLHNPRRGFDGPVAGFCVKGGACIRIAFVYGETWRASYKVSF